MAGKSSVVRVAIVADNSSLKRSLRESQTGLEKFKASAVRAGKFIGVSAALGMAAFAKSAVDVEAAFGKTMRTIGAVTNTPAPGLKRLSDLAIQLGQNTVFSANEAAQAMLALSKAGIDAETIYKGAAGATLDLATAVGTDLETAATIAANAMTAFGVEGKNLTEVTTALVGGANASTASVESLQQGLQQVGAGARSAGLNFSETVAVLAEFDNAGVKGSDAGTSLKTMLQRLVPSTKRASDEMKRLGLNFTDARGNFKPIVQIAEELRRGFKGMSDSQRSAALQTIFGSDASRAALILMRGGGKELRKYIKSTHDKEAADRAAKAATEGTSGALERMSSTIETAQLKLGQALAPAIADVADWLGKHLVPAMDAGIENGRSFVDAIEPLTGILVDIAHVGADVARFFDGLPAPMKSLAFQAGLAALAFYKLNPAIAASVGQLSRWSTAATSATGRAELLTGATARLGSAAKTAAGVGGLMLLAGGMTNAADKGVTMGNVLSGALGGAMTGLAVGGPIGALVGAVGGGGLSALSAALASTGGEAKATRAELMRTEGFQQAKADAESLREALQGVVNVYGEITRAAVKASFTGKGGKMDADIALLREAGVSMDTLVSATLGQADAQAKVAASFGASIGRQQVIADDAKHAWDLAKDGILEYRNEQGVVVSQHLSTAQQNIYKNAWKDAKGAVEETEAAQDSFNERIKENTGAVADHREQVRQLADQLGITVKAYNAFPHDVRTKFEAEGLPQTYADAARLIKQYKDLRNFKSIKALISAPGVDATREQIKRLAKQYGLTPKQVRTLFKTEGVQKVEGEVRGLVSTMDNAKDSASAAGADAGSAWGAGYVGGIRSWTGQAQYAAAAMAASAQAAAKHQDMSRSPSKVMYLAGQDFGEGYVRGIASKERAAATAATGLSRAAGKAARAVVAAISRIDFGKPLRDIGENEGRINDQLSSVTSRLQRFQEQQDRHASASYEHRLRQQQRALEKSLKARHVTGKKAAAAIRAAGLSDAQIDKKVSSREKARTRADKKALKGLSDEYAKLRAIGRQQDANAEALQKAVDAYDLLKQASDDYVDSVRGSFAAFADITQLGRDDEIGGVSFSALVDQLKDRAVIAQTFSEQVARFAAMGLDRRIVDQLLAAGPEQGAATAAAIQSGLDQGIDAIRTINELSGQITTAGDQLGAQLFDQFYKAGLNTAAGLIKGLQDNQAALNHAAETAAAALVKAVKHALGIRSPSSVMRKVGNQAAQGLALGFDSTYATRAGAGMAAALAGAVNAPTLKASAVSNGGAGSAAAMRVEVRLTAQQLSALERGRAIQLDLDTYRSAGGRGASR